MPNAMEGTPHSIHPYIFINEKYLVICMQKSVQIFDRQVKKDNIPDLAGAEVLMLCVYRERASSSKISRKSVISEENNAKVDTLPGGSTEEIDGRLAGTRSVSTRGGLRKC